MGSVVQEAIATFNQNVTLADGYVADWGGQWENQLRAAKRLQIVIPLSLIIVFALLYMALGNARSAGIIILTAPFPMIGGVAALYFAGVDLSISAGIGFITLLGQVALVGLLVLSAVELRRREGIELKMAITEGAGERMRADIMVTLLGFLGLLPMALSTGVGSEIQRPFALVIIGGIAMLPFVSLGLLPVLYAWLTRKDAGTEKPAPTPTESFHA
jgi:cobalt-zinc-cadmium resistance protein CzcA